MNSEEYRKLVRRLAKNVIKSHFPGLKQENVNSAAREIAIHVHARMYGANVNGVDSPIWKEINQPKLPNVPATEILKDLLS